MNASSDTIKDPSRRDFFTKIALASVACQMPLYLASCDDNAAEFVGSGRAPFKVWEEMVQAIMTSPDYLPGHMQRLIAAGDLEAMYHFVKDELVLIPPEENSMRGMGKQFKWGLDGVLRCGMATPREKAELLNHMFTEAGINSKVMYERTAIETEQVPAFFLRPVTRDFAPDISKKQLRKWKDEMNVEDTSNVRPIWKDYATESAGLSHKLFESLDMEERHLKPFDFRWDNYRTPTVVFSEEGIDKYAHLFDPKIDFGDLQAAGNKLVEAEPVQLNQDAVELSISYRKSREENEEMELVSGIWNARDLIGKQVAIQFLHGLTKEEQVVTAINQLRVFTPAIGLQGVGESKEFLEERSFIGDPITLEGEKIYLEAKDGQQSHESRFLAKPRPDLQKEITTMNVTAFATNFPTVKLKVIAQDANGNIIEGLGPQDFVIKEDGVPVRAILENNQRTPRVLILSDNSGSMPKEYYGKGMDRFNETLKASILKDFPAAELAFWKTSSNLFSWLLNASKTDYDVIIFATDGDNGDQYKEKNLPLYEEGPPALILNVKNSKWKNHADTFSKMAEVTGGKVFDAKDQQSVLNELAAYIQNLEPAPYLFSYGSAQRDTEHLASVHVDNDRIQATTTYQFPKEEDIEASGIIGVYLDLKIGNKTKVRRVLAGWDPLYDHNSENNNKNARAVKSLFLGGAFLSIEGEGPTLAMALTDLLSAKLSHRDWGEAYMDDQIMEAKDLLDKGVTLYPSELLPLMGPLQDSVTETSLTFPAGYRMALLKTSIGINGDDTVLSFDYLPTSNYVSIATNKVTAFQTTLEKTAQLALREATFYEQSAYSLLGESPLKFHGTRNWEWLTSNGINRSDRDARFWEERIFRGSSLYKISHANAQSKAYWQVDKRTGEMYGILPDGSGGGKSPFKTDIDGAANVTGLLMSIITIITHVGSMFGVTVVGGAGAVSLGIVAKYGVTLVKLYAIVSEAILVMDTTGMSDKIKKELQTLACQVFKEITYGTSGKPGATMAGLETIIGEMTSGKKSRVKNPFKCK